MSVSALALALALLLGPRRRLVRTRAGVRLAPGSPRRVPVTADDPLAYASALDIFAVCLSAGLAVATAARATAPCAPPAMAHILMRAADLLALGADPAIAWSQAPDEDIDEQCLTLLRLARRSAASGSALADAVAELATDAREHAGHSAAAAAERASVVIAGPLGVCFLPAFVCLGIIPVVAGLATDVFSSGLL
ncbi:MAG: type II secretion system F family protein [Mycobacterium sp.]|nr:type II secretion system F family protein [Mycobacterium sp.]